MKVVEEECLGRREMKDSLGEHRRRVWLAARCRCKVSSALLPAWPGSTFGGVLFPFLLMASWGAVTIQLSQSLLFQ